MAVTALDHGYVETTHRESSLESWHRLGFTVVEQWGSAGHRAGRLFAGSAAIVLAEVAGDPAFTLFFRLDDPEALDAGAAVAAPLQPTHWGTRMIRARDPEGRIHALEVGT